MSFPTTVATAPERAPLMSRPRATPRRLQNILKFTTLILMVAGIGLPINDAFLYFLLLIAATTLAVGRMTTHPKSWALAGIVVVAAIAVKFAADGPRIEEGHNIFLPGGANNALVTGLPNDVYREMAAELHAMSPAAGRCRTSAAQCWERGPRPRQVYAFSFDGIYDRPAFSRRVMGIDFSDPVWQRLGFINEVEYNWYTGDGDIDRGRRQRGPDAIMHPWRILMPHFVVYRFPAAYLGSQLCWKGNVMWEDTDGTFALTKHTEKTCRPIETRDIGKQIFGLAISPQAPLAMTLQPTTAILLTQLVHPISAAVVVVLLLFLLVNWQPRRLIIPLTFIGLSLLVMVANDASLIGGTRPFDGGDDGLVFDGWSRIMVQQLLAGDVIRALEGVEPVFYFTPGSRYLRAIEHLIFGETYFGYVSLLLLLPFLVLCLFRRFLGPRAALSLSLIFVALPIGVLFGSTYYLYVKHAAHGYGDSAAAILFVAATIGLIGRSPHGPSLNFVPGFGTGLLFALAVFVRPNLAIGTAVLLGGAGLLLLWQRQTWRLAGLCLGFLPVFGMTLHNWYYGDVIALFSSPASLAAATKMPPSAYLSALEELFRLEFAGADLARGALQVRRMLIGPAEFTAMIPVHAAALAIVIRVSLSRIYEVWLRLVAAATLGLYSPALFFLYSVRYQIVAWLLTLVVFTVWMRNEGMPWLDRHIPGLFARIKHQSAVAWLTRRLDGFARAAGWSALLR